MSHRLRKFIGVMGMVLFSIMYFWLVISIALARLPGTETATQLVFYFIASVIWFVICAAVIWWMRPRDVPGSGEASPPQG